MIVSPNYPTFCVLGSEAKGALPNISSFCGKSSSKYHTLPFMCGFHARRVFQSQNFLIHNTASDRIVAEFPISVMEMGALAAEYRTVPSCSPPQLYTASSSYPPVPDGTALGCTSPKSAYIAGLAEWGPDHKNMAVSHSKAIHSLAKPASKQPLSLSILFSLLGHVFNPSY